MKKLLLIAVGLALMGQGCLSRSTPPVPPAPAPFPQPVACTMDARQCPDGSYVGRTGPNCEFVCPSTPAPVPESSEQNMPPQEPTPAPAPSAQTSTYNAAIQNFAFGPKSITVKKGDKIIFQNRDSVGHTVTSDTGAFDSGILNQNGSYTLDTSNPTCASGLSYADPISITTSTQIRALGCNG